MMKRFKPKSEFSRNVLTLMTGTTIAQAIPIAISPILTRIYTPADFGVFALFIAIVGMFGTIASGRYEMAIMLPKKDENAINIVALGLIITIFISLALLVFILIFDNYLTMLLNNKEIGFWLYFVPISVFFVGFFNVLSYFNNRKKYYKDIANATMLKSIVLAIIQLLIGFLKPGATGLISGQIISNAFANMKLLKNISKDKKLLSNISKPKMMVLAEKYKDFPKFQAPHAFSNNLSSNMPIYLFSSFFNSMIVGFYSLSIRIVFAPLMIIAGASAKVYNQHISDIRNQKGDSYGFTVRVLKSLLKKIIIPFLIIVIFAPSVFAFIFGEEWREAGVYTQILSPWLLMVFMVATVSYIPSLYLKQKQAFMLEVVYVISRLIVLSIGVYLNDIYVALSLFSFISFLSLSYTMYWYSKLLTRNK